MLQDLLWLYGAKRQYDIQKEAGLAGLIGVIATLFIILQWDNLFFPFLNAIGLVELVQDADLVDKTIRETFINISLTALFFILALGFSMALPMLFLMSIVAIVGKDTSRPNPLQFAVGLLFLPIMLAVYIVLKLLQFFGILKDDRDTVEKYINDNVSMKKVVSNTKAKQLDSELLHLLTIQENQKGEMVSYNELTHEEAITVLNRAIPSLEDNSDFLFAFDEQYKCWYILFPNPIPVFASETLLDTRPEVSPFNFEKLSRAQLAFSTGSSLATKPLFYVPAIPITFEYDTTKKIFIKLVSNHNGFVACVDKLAKIVKVKGAFANNIYSCAVKNAGIKTLVNKAHSYAYTIPLAYPEEVNMFKDPSCTFSYYKALQEVPYSTKYCELYKSLVFETVHHKAASGHLWAKGLVK
ncbi:hypothetical protein ACIQYL_20830 [Lysinibacillus xylanilyticus]|uniref:hypothetical protein n=1 Tax=Lysinibacillus xylanilyticus TaxID=582475 RepID=UPI0037F1F443